MKVKNSVKNISTAFKGQIIIMIFSFITRTFFIHYLGKELLGVNAVFSNLLNIFSIVELGVGQAITLRLYKAIAKSDEEEIALLLSLYKRLYSYIALAIVVIAMITMPFLGFFMKSTGSIKNLDIIYILFVINSVLPYIYAYKTALIIADEKNFIVAKINYITSILTNILEIILLVVTKSYILYLMIAIACSLMKNLYVSNKLKKLYPYLLKGTKKKLDSEKKKSIFSEIKLLTIYKVGTISLNYTDNIIISSFIGLTTVGIYSNYNLIISSIATVLGVVFQSLLATIGKVNITESTEKKFLIFNVLNLALFLVYGLSSICLLILLNPFMKLWLGAGFTLSKFSVVIIVFSFYLGGMLFATCNFRQTLGLFVYGKYRPIISAVLNLVISIALVKSLGIAGVLLGTIITRLLTNFWYDPYLIYKKEFKKPLSGYFKKCCSYLSVTVVSVLISIVICDNFQSNNLLILIFKVLVATTIFLLISAVLFIKTEEMQYLIRAIRAVLKGEN